MLLRDRVEIRANLSAAIVQHTPVFIVQKRIDARTQRKHPLDTATDHHHVGIEPDRIRECQTAHPNPGSSGRYVAVRKLQVQELPKRASIDRHAHIIKGLQPVKH